MSGEKPRHLYPNPESDNTSWYFTNTPNKGDVIEIGKEYYQVLGVIFQAIRNRNKYDNPPHKVNTLVVKNLGRFDQVKIFTADFWKTED